ncbi:VOC family protein [Pseudomonas sp. NFIX28]|uniref:VOC family protein n=1 Tax=Pseudomonas sp. NFIX28 TaxID=1566235 RepID=UPI00089BCA75|nr:VOC family protein [Pseudomonas sp. NFIX28]SDZ61164.1 Catechol 2,3-dioxygenase [Pseudomonas sp. NFIX28]
MSVQLDHTIVWCRDKQRSADFLVQLLGLPPPLPFGPMLVVQLDNGVSLDYYNDDPPIASQHYAFVVAAADFEPILQRIRQRGLAFWADPGKQRANEINRHEGGRRVYFDDPDGHLLEVFSQT